MRRARDGSKKRIFIFGETDYESVQDVLIPCRIGNMKVKNRTEITEEDISQIIIISRNGDNGEFGGNAGPGEERTKNEIPGNNIKTCNADEETHLRVIMMEERRKKKYGK